MHDDVEGRAPVRSARIDVCPEHALRLFPTVVGPRCPVCGAAALRGLRLAG